MFKSFKKNSLFYTIFFYFITAIFGAFIFLLFTNTYYLNILQEKTKEQYAHELKNLSETLNTIVEEIHYTTAMFNTTEDLREILTTRWSFKNDDLTVLTNSMHALSTFKRTKSFIHSIIVISEEDDLVLTNFGTGRIEEFFHVLMDYDKYDTDYWLNVEGIRERYRLLPPSIVTNNVTKVKTKVIPIMQFSADNRIYTDPVIVNLEASYFESLLNETKLSDNSILFHFTQDFILSITDAEPHLPLSEDALIQLAQDNQEKARDIIHINGKRYLIVTYNSPMFHHTVCAITPYSDLWRESWSILILALIIFSIGLVLLTFLSFKLSSKIYAPIHSVTLRLKEQFSSDSDTTIKNDLDFLNHSFQSILSEIVKLKADLNLAIPYVCERYLVSLFEDSEILNEEEVVDFLAQYDFNFPNKNFMVIYSVLNFNKSFYELHTKAEFNAICQGSLLIANESFSALEHRYIFSPAANQICVILNLPHELDKKKITESIFKYHDALDIANNLLIVHSGVGLMYSNLNGLKKSYKEALEASSQITYLTKSMIRTYNPTDNTNNFSRYTIEEENHLINYLLQGDEAMVMQQYDMILDRNLKENISCHALKELYLRLYNTTLRVINRRNHNIYDIMGEDYINISSQLGELHIDKLYTYVKNVYLRTILIHNKECAAKDIKNLKAYLDAHYTEDIYLDAIAEYYGKSANYMSKYIKKTLGVSYQDYISSLRIEKAKDYLKSTNISINDISKKIGFNTRYPFIRKFKILEGITPSEYRQLHKVL
ncbi:helix-turn-helix domain-containing protein [Vallitalea pronyensis]|uniref:Helix-turn-helix domain-containing protein n=1 Tax=Vallitalea pronyensis TaxID=1348613 RepID=A0A8J8SGM7_9FIRM|nr:helix-turn-helix domain-containing protein [Vallitalea pronyensis]QUI22766.1 helix-turn-helix domain-containing protein [Vallitalea pronyensis]